MAKVILTPEAIEDILEIYNYIKQLVPLLPKKD
jgi:plasmid stabilization system protein ParE